MLFTDIAPAPRRAREPIPPKKIKHQNAEQTFSKAFISLF
jgi:hypothetical protein